MTFKRNKNGNRFVILKPPVSRYLHNSHHRLGRRRLNLILCSFRKPVCAGPRASRNNPALTPWVRHTSGPLPLSSRRGLRIQARLCGARSVAPYVGNKAQNGQATNSNTAPCLFDPSTPLPQPTPTGRLCPPKLKLTKATIQPAGASDWRCTFFMNPSRSLTSVSTRSGGAVWICECCLFSQY